MTSLQRMMLVLMIVAFAHLAQAQMNGVLYSASDPRWHDDDITNDPNSCHETPGLCTTEDHWRWGWFDARCRAFRDDACLHVCKSEERAANERSSVSYACAVPAYRACFDSRIAQDMSRSDAHNLCAFHCSSDEQVN